MAAPIDFYFDFSSPYGYLAAQKIEALAEKHGRTVDWHPMLLGVVFKETGAAPLTMVPLKGDYSRRDFERSARFHGIAGFRMPPKFPIASQAPARIVLWPKARDPALAVRVAKALYRAYLHRGPRHLRSRGAASVAAQRGPRCRGGARGGRRSGDEGCAQARSRAGDRARRVRLAVHHRRRRAVLGARPPRPGRALARNRRVLAFRSRRHADGRLRAPLFRPIRERVQAGARAASSPAPTGRRASSTTSTARRARRRIARST